MPKAGVAGQTCAGGTSRCPAPWKHQRGTEPDLQPACPGALPPACPTLSLPFAACPAVSSSFHSSGCAQPFPGASPPVRGPSEPARFTPELLAASAHQVSPKASPVVGTSCSALPHQPVPFVPRRTWGSCSSGTCRKCSHRGCHPPAPLKGAGDVSPPPRRHIHELPAAPSPRGARRLVLKLLP